MVSGIGIDLFDFQEKAVLKLIDLVGDDRSKQTITVKSPTGSGKTIILIDFIDEYLDKVERNVAFIWLCPGKGDLEEQSHKKMQKFAPHLKSQNLFDALQYGFSAESTTFINWEAVTKKGKSEKTKNTALRDGEKKNLFDRIAEAHRANTRFIVIIDEEHSNDTKNAKEIIDAFSASHIIRVSATAVKNERFEYFEIDELDVINAGLITKAISVNEGITDDMILKDDDYCFLDLADAKRKEIAQRYKIIGAKIRPLVLIQFPNGEPDKIVAVEEKLESMGYTYENGMVSKWMSEDKKDLPDNLTENDGVPVFLLMKQAISTGWDCPRAKILVKLREGGNQSFQIQTIGRIRRMPEAKHYEDDMLDFCYVYTFDPEYKAGLLTLDKAYETRRLFLKEKCKTFTLEKQTRNLDFGGLGEREVMRKLHASLVEKYQLGNDKKQNKMLLADAGYIFGDTIRGQVLKGVFVRTTSLTENESFHSYHREVNTHNHGILLLHAVDSIKTAIGMQTAKVKAILERLFRRGVKLKNNLVLLNTREFYAFVINNEKKLKYDFREATANMVEQLGLTIEPKVSVFHMPEQDFYKYDASDIKNEVEYLNNAYQGYTSCFATDLVRSTSEVLFEQYCEEQDDIDWVYKNGDSGQQYFSIVYVDALRHQWLFYPDYIIKKKDGTIWVIETKGGESKGKDKNIDIQIENKFNAFKQYAEEKGLHWGFVRDKNYKLYINNTIFALNMADEHWQPLNKVFK